MGEIRYGHIRGGEAGFPAPMGASEVFYSKSGRFVINDTAGRMELADENDTYISGWVQEGQPDDGIGGGGFTCSTTEGLTEMFMITDLDAVFRMPLAYDASTYDKNYSSALLGEVCDIVVVNKVQYANVSASSKDNIRIVGGKAASAAWVDGAVDGLCLGDGYVDVQLIASKRYTAGVE